VFVRSHHLAAVDVGTSFTQVWTVSGTVRMPSVVIRQPSGSLIVGDRVRSMVGRTPRGVQVLRPLAHGVIRDLDAGVVLLRAALGEVGSARGARVCVSVPAGATEVERRSLALVIEAVTGREPVLMVDEPLAAAVGARIPVHDVTARMIVDIGDGITEALVTTSGATAALASRRVGGSDLDIAIVRHLRDAHDLIIGDHTAEWLKRRLAIPEGLPLTAGGRRRGSGRPARIEVERAALHDALAPTIESIVATACDALAGTAPELCRDLIDTGITLVGGTARLPGLAATMARATGLTVRVEPRATSSVLRGNVAALHGDLGAPTRYHPGPYRS
jgi:rod shape-determining protein MreB and related proteins